MPGRPPNAPSTAFVRLEHELLDCEAWQTLDPFAAKLFLAVWRRFTGRNNGNVPFSVREAQALLGCGKTRAVGCFRELTERGFLAIARRPNASAHVAREWKITAATQGGCPASKDYLKWAP